MAGRDAKPHACANCGTVLGSHAEDMPMFVNETDDPKKADHWCPQCFVHKRAPMEPKRWVGVRAVACGGCGKRMLDFTRGSGRTPCCGRKMPILQLPPRVTIATA